MKVWPILEMATYKEQNWTLIGKIKQKFFIKSLQIFKLCGGVLKFLFFK